MITEYRETRREIKQNTVKKISIINVIMNQQTVVHWDGYSFVNLTH